MMCAATERVISRQEDIHRHPHHQSSSGGEQVAGLRQNVNHHGNAAGTGGGGGAGGEGRVRVMLSRAKRVAPPISGAAWTGQSDSMVMMPAAQEGRMPGQRVNLQEQKAKLCKILGPTREQQYWSLLSSFLNFKLSKQELDKLLPAAIGRENIVLHNQLLRAIFLNAIAAEAPSTLPAGPQSNSNSPSSYNASSLNAHDTSKPVKGVRRRPISSSSPAVSDDPSPSPGQPSPSGNVTPVWANGDAIISPRKGRSAIRDRKAKDRPSPLGLLKVPDSCQPPAEEDGRRLEHAAGPGFRTGPDHTRSFQQGDNAVDHSLPSPSFPLAKRPKHALFVPNGLIGPAGHLQDASFAHDDDAVEDDEGIIWATRSVQAPLGVPFCKASVGAPQKAPVLGVPGPLTHTLLGYNIEDECIEASELLPDTYSMMRQMQQTAVVEAGLQGVTVEAANVLNYALDVYLKRMILPAIKLAQCRRSKDQSGASCSSVRGGGSGDKEVKNFSSAPPQKQIPNGVCSSHTYNHVDATDGLSEDGVLGNGENGFPPVTPMDLMGSLETNPPALLGEDWPLLLEKVSLRLLLHQ